MVEGVDHKKNKEKEEYVPKKFKFVTYKQISLDESCLSHPAEIMTVFEPLFSPKKSPLEPETAQISPSPQLVPYSHNPPHDSLYQYTQK